jgi:GDPmannose 4,6-dehydratase
VNHHERQRALVTGIGGQDGSYLAELLLGKGYEVFGVTRTGSADGYANLDAIRDELSLIKADPLDKRSLVETLEWCEPDEVYNLASVSFVPASWDEPVLTAKLAAVGVTVILEAIRTVNPAIRFYQASSSEIFGEPVESPQSPDTPLSPLTPYGVAKAYGHLITRSYRERYGLHSSSGILYNHESPRRPPKYVTRKVTQAAARISLGLEEELVLGDLEARRDWGYAPDYVRAMWLMLQRDEPGDYVIATGVAHSVQDLVVAAFAHVGLDWRGHVRTDTAFERGKAELHNLVGDASKAREELGWQTTVTFSELVRLLVDTDLERIRATQDEVKAGA